MRVIAVSKAIKSSEKPQCQTSKLLRCRKFEVVSRERRSTGDRKKAAQVTQDQGSVDNSWLGAIIKYLS